MSINNIMICLDISFFFFHVKVKFNYSENIIKTPNENKILIKQITEISPYDEIKLNEDGDNYIYKHCSTDS